MSGPLVTSWQFYHTDDDGHAVSIDHQDDVVSVTVARDFDDDVDDRDTTVRLDQAAAESLHESLGRWLGLEVGELGLPYSVAGSAAQALGAQAVDRGNVTREQVKAYLSSDGYDEDVLWTVLGPLVDEIEDGASSTKVEP